MNTSEFKSYKEFHTKIRNTVIRLFLLLSVAILFSSCEKKDEEERNNSSEHALISITEGGELDWHVQFSQDISEIQIGVLYELTFDAHASKNVRIYCDLNQAGGDYKGILHYSGIAPFFEISTTENTFSVSTVSTINDDGDGHSAIQFNLGALGPYDIYFDNISVKADGVEQIINGDFTSPITTGWNELFLDGTAEATLSIVTP
ncbi:MAG: hypothetical protein JW894_01790 [Bacteroidales bacterium]|nr:hypothetical protein [Bacteroidales bacterium]